MSRIKAPEFKENELISSEQFNELNSHLKSFTVNEENIANEAINESLVEEGTTFSDVSSIQRTTKDFNTKLESSYLNWKFSDGHWLYSSEAPRGPTDDGSITLTNIPSTSKVLVRCSCRLFIPDVGAKTFYAGRNPIVDLSLRYRTNVSDTASPAEGWQTARETMQSFGMAFSGKVASDSGGSEMTAKHSGVILKDDDPETEDLRLWEFYPGKKYGLDGRTVEDREASSDELSSTKTDTTNPSKLGRGRYNPRYLRYNTLSGDYSYTVAFLLDSSRFGIGVTDLTNVQFALWGSAHTFKTGMHTSTPADAQLGCYQPLWDGFKISDLQLYAYEIKK